MNNTKELEQKLEELIEQLNELCTQLSADDNCQSNEATLLEDNTRKVENLKSELQRLKAKRCDIDISEPQLLNKDTKRNGWNYVSRYLQNRL